MGCTVHLMRFRSESHRISKKVFTTTRFLSRILLEASFPVKISGFVLSTGHGSVEIYLREDESATTNRLVSEMDHNEHSHVFFYVLPILDIPKA